MHAAAGPITIVEVDGASTAIGAATSGFKWRLIAAVFGTAAAATFKFTSGGSDLTGDSPNTTGAVVVIPPSDGWIEGADNQDLTLAGSGAIDGWVTVQKIRCNQSTPGYAV